MEEKIKDILTSVMQDFFRIRMTEAFGTAWRTKVADQVEARFAADDIHKTNYQGIHDVLTDEGIENLTEKSMDVTSISSLIRFDFFRECRLGTNLKPHIKRIADNKNMLFSHSPNLKDTLAIKILQLTALKDLRSFLHYLSECQWNSPEKQDFLDRYTAQMDEVQAYLLRESSGDSELLDTESDRRVYLERIAGERAEHMTEYIPLSYKVDDNTSQRFSLEELFDRPENSGGFVLFSKEAGYGKTWSIQELAGRCAEEALAELEEHRPMPVLIRMGELAVHEEPILRAVQDALYPEDTTLDRARKLIGRESVILFIDGMDEAKQENKDSARRELARLRSSAKQLRIIGGTRETDLQWYPSELKRYAICDLSDRQVEEFFAKLIPDEIQRFTARYEYFKNPATTFLRNLKSPFYLKCYAEIAKSGARNLISKTDMMEQLLNKMIEREINEKGFRATPQIVDAFLVKLAELIEAGNGTIPEQEALRELQAQLIYDTEQYASVVQIKDTLVELQILTEIANNRQPVLLKFYHEIYRALYSPIARAPSPWG